MAEVHPRIRGEDSDFERYVSEAPGSPPHTRGRSLTFVEFFTKEGFTPAYAGKMMVLTFNRCSTRVHPRIRGEDKDLRRRLRRAAGSPPHTRGRCKKEITMKVTQGFTPAYAGKIKSDRL